MNIYDIKTKAINSEFREYLLGYKDTGSHACYLIYGILKAGEGERLIKPGKGHEEILLAMVGDLEVSGHYNCKLKEGQAIHLIGDEECNIKNNGTADAIYIVCGGHSEGGHH
ncbi:MAG: hypothetical protein N2511_05495 [Thermodesulfovibrionales bacterium]|nr:hypothetical protein [Thermodesulfovibrionales bacterium]